MSATPETKVKSKIKAWLKDHAAWWTSISDRYHIGLPDFMCIMAHEVHHGRFTAIEAKSSTGRLTQRQLHEARAIVAAGGRYYVARPGSSEFYGLNCPFLLSEITDTRRKTNEQRTNRG